MKYAIKCPNCRNLTTDLQVCTRCGKTIKREAELSPEEAILFNKIVSSGHCNNCSRADCEYRIVDGLERYNCPLYEVGGVFDD